MIRCIQRYTPSFRFYANLLRHAAPYFVLYIELLTLSFTLCMRLHMLVYVYA